MSEYANDGGPAFPMSSGPEPRVDATTHYNEGMALRDWFAGMALASGRYEGLMMNQTAKWCATKTAKYAYMVADEMLKERAVKL